MKTFDYEIEKKGKIVKITLKCGGESFGRSAKTWESIWCRTMETALAESGLTASGKTFEDYYKHDTVFDFNYSLFPTSRFWFKRA